MNYLNSWLPNHARHRSSAPLPLPFVIFVGFVRAIRFLNLFTFVIFVGFVRAIRFLNLFTYVFFVGFVRAI